MFIYKQKKKHYLHNYLHHLHDFTYIDGNRELGQLTNYLQYTYTLLTERYLYMIAVYSIDTIKKVA